MKSAIETAILIALIAVAFLCVELARTVHDLRAQLPATQKQISSLLTDADTAVNNVNSDAGVIHDAAQKEAAYYDPARPGGLPQQVQRTVVDLKNLIGRTDTALNGGPTGRGAIAQLNDALASTADLTKHAANDLDGTTAQLQPILADLGTGAAAFAKQTPGILSNLSDTSAQTVIVARNTADTTVSIDASAHDIQAFIHRETTPVRGTWNVIKGFLKEFLREFAGPAAQVATASK